MAQGLGALAQGFIQGSQIGMQFKKNERDAEESKELMKLRQAAEGRADDKAGMDKEAHEQNMSLRELQNARLDSQESRAVTQSQQNIKQSNQSIAASKQNIEQSNWQIGKERRAEEDKNLASIAPIEYQRVAEGGDFSPEFMEQASGTRFDPVYMAKPEYGAAAKVAYNHVGDLMAKVKADGVNSIGLGDVNKPEFLQSLGVLMAPDIKRGIGDKDAISGKTIVDKEIATIIPYENQGLVVDVKVTLDDGTSYYAPITEGRSRDPDDPVKIIPVDKFIDNIEGYTRMASAYNQPDLQNAVSRYSGTALKPNTSAEVTKRQLLRELGDIDRDEAKESSKLSADQYLEPDEKAKAVAALSDKYKVLRDRTSNRYGVMTAKPIGKDGKSVNPPGGGGKKMIDVKAWANGDPKRAAFIKSGEDYETESGESPFDAFSPSELEKLYNDWTNDQEADELAAAMKG